MPVHADALSAVNRIAEERAARLRQAVKKGGGNNRVSARSGVPLRTLGNYLKGRDIQSEALVALADACGVSIEWLATGRDAAAPAAPAPSSPPPLFSIVDMDLLGGAIDSAEELFRARGAESRGRPFAQIVCLLYDEAKQRLSADESKKKIP
jgi:transcriptional regulator with XRE-family HTH domain